jgi:hypothetical protein
VKKYFLKYNQFHLADDDDDDDFAFKLIFPRGCSPMKIRPADPKVTNNA